MGLCACGVGRLKEEEEKEGGNIGSEAIELSSLSHSVYILAHTRVHIYTFAIEVLSAAALQAI